MLTSSVICDFISLFEKRNVKKLKKKKKKMMKLANNGEEKSSNLPNEE